MYTNKSSDRPVYSDILLHAEHPPKSEAVLNLKYFRKEVKKSNSQKIVHLREKNSIPYQFADHVGENNFDLRKASSGNNYC